MEIASASYQIPSGVTSDELIAEIGQAWPSVAKVKDTLKPPRAMIAASANGDRVSLLRVRRGRSSIYFSFPVEVSISTRSAGVCLELHCLIRWRDLVEPLFALGLLLLSFWPAASSDKYRVWEVPIWTYCAMFVLVGWGWALCRHFATACKGVETLLENMANHTTEPVSPNLAGSS